MKTHFLFSALTKLQ